MGASNNISKSVWLFYTLLECEDCCQWGKLMSCGKNVSQVLSGCAEMQSWSKRGRVQHWILKILVFSRQTRTTTTPGLITCAWWRAMETPTRSEMFMREPSPTSPPSKRNGTGGDTSTSGSTMLCMKSWRSRLVPKAHGKELNAHRCSLGKS